MHQDNSPRRRGAPAPADAPTLRLYRPDAPATTEPSPVPHAPAWPAPSLTHLPPDRLAKLLETLPLLEAESCPCPVERHPLCVTRWTPAGCRERRAPRCFTRHQEGCKARRSTGDCPCRPRGKCDCPYVPGEPCRHVLAAGDGLSWRHLARMLWSFLPPGSPEPPPSPHELRPYVRSAWHWLLCAVWPEEYGDRGDEYMAHPGRDIGSLVQSRQALVRLRDRRQAENLSLWSVADFIPQPGPGGLQPWFAEHWEDIGKSAPRLRNGAVNPVEEVIAGREDGWEFDEDAPDPKPGHLDRRWDEIQAEAERRREELAARRKASVKTSVKANTEANKRKAG